MGDDESLFECEKNRSHIWSYHLDCKKGGDKREAKFIGWLPCDDYDEDELEDYSDASLTNHKRFLKKIRS